MFLRSRSSLCALAACLLPLPALADGFHSTRLSDATGRVTLDGELNEAAWRAAKPYDRFFQTEPTDKTAAPVGTTVRLLHDARFLYIGITVADPQVGMVRAPLSRRDSATDDQDLIGLYIDTGGARKSAQFILLNARGAVTDGNFTDASGEDRSFDFDFDVVTARQEGGWSAEIRIPFSSLLYDAAQKAPWQLLVYRNMMRDQRYRMYSGQVTQESNCLLCFSEPISGLSDLPSGLNWSVTPFAMLSRGREDVEGQDRRRYHSNEVGLDLKVRPDAATTIDATLRPDFSQVELDEPQLSGNSAFALFLQEKRPFFLEGSDMLTMPLKAVNTRTIASPSWGARYTRRDGNLDVTVLTARDRGGSYVQLPGAYGTNYASQDFASSATIARAILRRDTVSIGGLLTDRSLEQGRGYNRVLGTDFEWQRTDSERVRGQLLLSSTTALPRADGSLGAGERRFGHAAEIDWTRDTNKWGLLLSAEQMSDDFRADNGFIPQVGYLETAMVLTRKWGAMASWNQVKTYLYAVRKVDTDGKLIADDIYPALFLAGPYDTQIDLRLKVDKHRRLERDGPVMNLHQLYGVLSTSPSAAFAQVFAEVELGDQIELESRQVGRGAKLTTYMHLRGSPRLELEPSYSINWINGRQGAGAGHRLYTEYAGQLSAIYHFGPQDVLRVLLQRTSLQRASDLYDTPVAASSTSRTDSVVYSHIVGLGTLVYAGITRQQGKTPGFEPTRNQNEIFLKLAYKL